MFPGPVLIHELRTLARRTRFYVIRFLCGLAFLYFVFTFFVRWDTRVRALSIHELSAIGIGLFTMTLWIQGVTVVLLTPAIVAGTIAEDRQRKILHYLLASPLPSGEIVLSKLSVRLLYLVTLVLVGFPIMSLALLFGGVDPFLLLLTELSLLAGIFFLGSVSIFLSSRLKKPRDAILSAYVFVFAWLMLPVFSAIIESELIPRWPSIFNPVHQAFEFFSLSTPFGAIAAAEPRQAILIGSNVPPPPQPAYGLALSWMIGLDLLFGLLFLVPTIRGLRLREQNEGMVKRRWLPGRSDRGRDWLRHRPFGLDDPMLWKECAGHLQFRNPLMNVLAIVVRVVVVVCLATWMLFYAWLAFEEVLRDGYGQNFSYSDYRTAFHNGVRLATICGYLLLVLVLAAVSAGSVASEKEKDTWISLISTRLEGREILRGKVLGSLWTARYLFAGLVALWITALIVGAMHPLGLIAVVAATAVYSWFTVALGVHYSSICKTSTRALVATFATLLFLNGGYLFCCVPIIGRSDTPITFILSLAGVSILFVGGAPLSYEEWRNLIHTSQADPLVAIVLAFLGSLGGYGFAAAALVANRIAAFDQDVDRPRPSSRSTVQSPRHRPNLDATGIEFLADDDAAMDDVSDGPISSGQS